MMKKGFTLAEVLITLTIIGVVATLTLPSLMTNTTEQQAITAFRKVMNTLNEAGQMSAAIDGFDYGNLSETSAQDQDLYDENNVATQSLWAMLVNRTQVDVTRSKTNPIPKVNGEEGSNYIQVLFRDGTAVCFKAADAITQAGDAVIPIIIDTNGVKGPNLLFTCDDEQCSKNSKNIGDQFRVTLHGSNAIPGHVKYDNGVEASGEEAGDKAARWAMSK